MKTAEKIIVIVLVLLLFAGLYIGLRNIDFFNVKELDVSLQGPLSEPGVDMLRIIRPLKGRNILEINLMKVRKQLLAFDGVKDVTIKRYFPDTLQIQITYNDIALRAFSRDESGQMTYFLVYDQTLEVVSSESWEAFDKLSCVELNPAYSQMIVKWGADEGFADMLAMATHLGSNNLITSIKYDNNNGKAFGRLAVEMSNLNVMLYIREKISAERLDEALGIIGTQFSASGAQVYDLYANTLVKRT